MHKTDFHVLVRNKKGDITLCNAFGRLGNNRYMGSLTLTQDDLTPVQAEAVKENRQRYILNNENNATEFILALEDHFGDKQTVIEIARSWNVTQAEIQKHYGDYLDACTELNADKAYNADFWQRFLIAQFKGCQLLQGSITTEIASAHESYLNPWEESYTEAAKEKYAEMVKLELEIGNATNDSEAYAMASNRFDFFAKQVWQIRRRKGEA